MTRPKISTISKWAGTHLLISILISACQPATVVPTLTATNTPLPTSTPTPTATQTATVTPTLEPSPTQLTSTPIVFAEEIYKPPLPLLFGAWPATSGCPNHEELQESAELNTATVTYGAGMLLYTGNKLYEKAVSDPALWPLLPFANRSESSGLEGFDETWIDSIRKAGDTEYAQLLVNQCGEEVASLTWVAKICPGPCAQNASESLKDDLFFINRAGMWLIWAVY